MATFKLLAGQHVQADKTARPKRFVHPETGEVREEYPSKTFHAGDLVESDDDLAARHGEAKFQLIDGGKKEARARATEEARRQAEEDDNQRGAHVPDPPRMNPAVFPSGQVSSGKQEATGQVVQRETGIPSGPDHEYHDEAIADGAAEDKTDVKDDKKDSPKKPEPIKLEKPAKPAKDDKPAKPAATTMPTDKK